jgi:hypothetical protein
MIIFCQSWGKLWYIFGYATSVMATQSFHGELDPCIPSS